jgi:nitrogenase molybdenum-cofactor synthesis protein NifE
LAINNSIKQAIDNYDPPAVSIYNTCVPALVGDDIGDPDSTERT